MTLSMHPDELKALRDACRLVQATPGKQVWVVVDEFMNRVPQTDANDVPHLAEVLQRRFVQQELPGWASTSPESTVA